MTDRELMQQALAALDRVMSHGSAVQEAKDILRERLAQPLRTHWEGCEQVHPECRKPEQEPVAHTLNCVCGAVWDVSPDGVEEMVHAPNPPQRKPLTDEEALELWNKHEKHWRFENNALAFTRAIEAAHGIKENT